MMIFYLLMIDQIIYAAGIKWLAYPANIMVIVVIAMTVNMVRTIAANAFLPPKVKNSNAVIMLITAVGVSLLVVLFSTKLDLFPGIQNEQLGDGSAIILAIVSAAGLVISAFIAILKRILNNKSNENE